VFAVCSAARDKKRVKIAMAENSDIEPFAMVLMILRI
jgi:hypothetical protein